MLDFEGEVTNYGVHSIYSYPARFIPQIPRFFIQKYNPDVVCDCFGGSGTTVVEAKLHGVFGIHMDIMPISFMLAKTKTHEFTFAEMKHGEFEINEALDNLRYGPLIEGYRRALTFRGDEEYYFTGTVQQEIQAIREAILFGIRNTYNKYFYSLCAAQALRSCSQADPRNYEWVKAKSPALKNKSYVEAFRQKISRARRSFDEYYQMHPQYFNGIVPRVIDTKKGFLRESIDLIVTSPPYGKLEHVINYPDIHKFSHLFFCKEPDPKKRDFIQSMSDLGLYMTKVLGFLKKGGHCIVVVAPSANDDWVVGTANVLKNNGLEKVKHYERRIPDNRKYSARGIKTEWVLDYVAV